jgi:D-alanyl-D-alanine carboxypeptidase
MLQVFRRSSVAVASVVLLGTTLAVRAEPARRVADANLDRALQALVRMPGGPPGVIAIVQRGGELRVHRAGVGDVDTRRAPEGDDFMRIASVAKAFSGAVALSLVDDGVLGLDDTIGTWLPQLPAEWHAVTLRQLLAHTSGLPDFTATSGLRDAFFASPTVAPPPSQLLSFAYGLPLEFTPGTRYHYSNSDNIAVGLMCAAAAGKSYEDLLAQQVTNPLGLGATTLPAGIGIGTPYIHGYAREGFDVLEDQTLIAAAGWAWASGGVVSTPRDLNTFIRGYVSGALFGSAVQDEQAQFFPGGGSEPRGPGDNSAGLALFRYETTCGTVYGHTGNTFGYTQFAAASRDGDRSVTVSINLQRTQNNPGNEHAVFLALRRAEQLAVCAALAD